MFDKSSKKDPVRSVESEESGKVPEDERIALRCNRRELQLLDSFVASGEFRSRSELMREALREFTRTRALSGVPATPRVDSEGIVEVPVRLRAEEWETLQEYARLVANGRTLSDLLAEFVRRAELELKVSELVSRARNAVHQAAETRARLGALQGSGKDLERKGVVGR